MFRYNQQSQKIYEWTIDDKLDNKKARQSSKTRWMALYQFSKY